MKKIFFTLSFCVLFAYGTFAQGISGGLKVGANISNAKQEFYGESETGDSKIGLMAGGYLTAMLSDKVGIQPELLFSSMGMKESDSDFNWNLNYISIPVLFRYNFNEMVNLQVGPQVGILASAKAKFEGNSVDMKDYFNGVDFGAVAGLGFDFGKFNAGARYYMGLSNIASDELLDGEDGTVKNNSIQLFAGIKLFGN